MQLAEKSREKILTIKGNTHDGYDVIFKDGRTVHCKTKLGARVCIFDIRTNENTLKILMCCITDIQPNDFPEFPSTTLYYMNYFVNCQTK